VVCPRCQRESEAESAACAQCGAPLLIGDDPPTRALDRPVMLDRRGRDRERMPPADEVPGVALPALGASAEAERLEQAPGAARPSPRHHRARDDGAHPVDASTDAPPAHPRLEEGGRGRGLWWRRSAARAVDLGVIALFAAIPLAIAGGLDAAPDADRALLPHAAAFAAILAFVYETLAHYLAGATAGKHLLRLQVVNPDGGSPELGRSAARAAVSVFGAVALGLPILAPLFTRRGRPLHDAVAGTSVVLAP
jgi:uncharacterized RDD family membrane protein YckC